MSTPEIICPVCQKPVNPRAEGAVSPFERPARYLHPECDQAEWERQERERLNNELKEKP